ncbi:MAG: hypothetical protein BWY47_01646 [Bacteroidetes bacterium ADurb.Bin302]|nr:MAG: hypothetical protein BWY47_01646 [Bacteroidetes bacterium ADurb.Bin302]
MDATRITNCLQDYEKLLDRADRIIAVTEGRTFYTTEVKLSNITPNAIIIDCYDGALSYYEDARIRIPIDLFENEFNEDEVKKAKERGDIVRV